SIVTVLCVIATRQVHAMENAFPDATGVVSYVRAHMTPKTTIMSEDAYLFRYSLRGKLDITRMFETGYFDNDHDGKHTARDVVDAVWDGKPEYVFLDGRVTPGLTHKLRTSILAKHYTKVYDTAFETSTVMTMGGAKGHLELYRRNGDYRGKYPLV